MTTNSGKMKHEFKIIDPNILSIYMTDNMFVIEQTIVIHHIKGGIQYLSFKECFNTFSVLYRY